MKTIISENSRFPNSKESLPNLIISKWVKEKLNILSNLPSTPANEITIKRLNNVKSGEAIVEPPVIVNDSFVKICIISRAAGVLWFDEKIKRISFDDFLNTIFSKQEANSSIYREIPYTIQELEAIVRSEKSLPIPGYINVQDSDKSIKKVIIADTLNDQTIQREKLFGDYLFEKTKTNIFGFAGDPTPIYPFNSLNNMAVAITEIEDVFFKEKIQIYSISINLLRSLIQKYETPPVIIKTSVAGDNTINEEPNPTNILITNNLMVTFDIPPNLQDLIVRNIVDDNGKIINSEDYNVRVSPTTDPLILEVSINLENYIRNFFAPDEIGKKFSFTVTLGIDPKEGDLINKPQSVYVHLNQLWKNPGNTHLMTINNFEKTFKTINNFPLTISLQNRFTKEIVSDLHPLLFNDVYSLLKPGLNTPYIVDTNFELEVINNNIPTIKFNLQLNNYGWMDISFKDTRILPHTCLLADPLSNYSGKLIHVEYDETNELLFLTHFLDSPYTEEMGNGDIVTEYENPKITINSGLEITPEIIGVADGGNALITLFVPYTGVLTNVKCSFKATAYVGLNKISVPFTSEYIYNPI